MFSYMQRWPTLFKLSCYKLQLKCAYFFWNTTPPNPWPPSLLTASLGEGWWVRNNVMKFLPIQKLCVFYMLTNQQAQWNTEFPKHFAFVAIFLTPVSLWENAPLTGDRWILSMMLILGASRIALGRVNAYCMAQIESGLMYMRDR